MLDHFPQNDAGLRTVTADLLRAYDRPGPRYTSYPTAVEFRPGLDEAAYREHLSGAARHVDTALSLYVHLPFCEHRCDFCGCQVVATHRREVAARYLDALDRELALLAGALGARRRVVQCHWGGGTPTYLSPDQLEALHASIARRFDLERGAELAIEVDPRVTTGPHLERLRALGFNRLSMGVQDLTPEVQAAIGRHQTEAQTRQLFGRARDAGFEAINIDLVYGLPRQTLPAFARTVDNVIALGPERVATYSYAHVPWLRPHQKRIDPVDLPQTAAKFALIGLAIERFQAAGYVSIGMDHFARPDDELAVAAGAGRLHRNFMGYTTRSAPDLLGAGISAISEIDGMFVQNTRSLAHHARALDADRLPVDRGYVLDPDDRIRQHVIGQLMCNFRVDAVEVGRRFGIRFADYFARELTELAGPAGPVAHGFLDVGPDGLAVTSPGRLFVRNICMAFDRYLKARATAAPAFSRTI